MKLAIRFWYYKAVQPSLHFAELDTFQWRNFLGMQKPDRRRDYIMNLLHLEYLQAKVREMWWIPLDDYMEIKIHRKKKLPELSKVTPTKEQIEQFRAAVIEELKKLPPCEGMSPQNYNPEIELVKQREDSVLAYVMQNNTPEQYAEMLTM